MTGITRREVAEAEDVLALARAFVEWDKMPYMEKYKAWLVKKAMEPIMLSDPDSMVSTAAKTNAYKEMLEHLRVQAQSASAALGE